MEIPVVLLTNCLKVWLKSCLPFSSSDVWRLPMIVLGTGNIQGIVPQIWYLFVGFCWVGLICWIVVLLGECVLDEHGLEYRSCQIWRTLIEQSIWPSLEDPLKSRGVFPKFVRLDGAFPVPRVVLVVDITMEWTCWHNLFHRQETSWRILCRIVSGRDPKMIHHGLFVQTLEEGPMLWLNMRTGLFLNPGLVRKWHWTSSSSKKQAKCHRQF